MAENNEQGINQNPPSCVQSKSTQMISMLSKVFAMKNMQKDHMSYGVKEIQMVDPIAETEIHAAEIDRITKQSHLCDDCAGLDFCKQNCKGYYEEYFFPAMYQGRFTSRMSHCSYEKARRRQLATDHLFQFSGIPDRYRAATFDKYEEHDGNRRAIVQARNAINTNMSLFLYGDAGAGKTFLASIIGNEKMKNGFEVLFESFPSFIVELKNTIGENGKTAAIMKKAQDVNTLIIDDLGAERLTAWAEEQLFLLIDARYNAMKQTIITSNYNLDELQEYLAYYSEEKQAPIMPERIVRRIDDMSAVVKITKEGN